MLDDWRKAHRIYPPYPIAMTLTIIAVVGSNFASQWTWWHALTLLLGRPQ